MVQVISKTKFQIEGKSTNKEEFVTCGGVCFKEVDHKTMESKLSKRIVLHWRGPGLRWHHRGVQLSKCMDNGLACCPRDSW
jgi:hypothetical protein